MPATIPGTRVKESTVTQAELATLLDDLRGRLHPQLDAYTADPAIPPRLREAIRYSLLAPGKRIRPCLTLMTCQACGGTLDDALPAACAVEMIHTYSLIHDDLPAMDDDDLRRGLPTCHRQFDEATAILAGDALLTLAFEVLTKIQPAELAVSCASELARAAGAAGMIGGQMDDLLNEGNQQGNLEQLQSIHRRKTGALLTASVRLGALIGLHSSGRRSSELLESLTQFATHLGLAFQIKDDLLDLHGTAAAAGKATQKDPNRGKLTYPGLLGVEQTQKHLREAHSQALAALDPLGTSADPLRSLLQFVVDRDR
jgi:geranylgeranyl diphosphate synthase, type II